MDNLRIILFAALAFILMLLWQAWVEDYGAAPSPVAADNGVPGTASPISEEVPPAPVADATAEAGAPLPPGAKSAGVLSQGERVVVTTDGPPDDVIARQGVAALCQFREQSAGALHLDAFDGRLLARRRSCRLFLSGLANKNVRCSGTALASSYSS